MSALRELLVEFQTKFDSKPLEQGSNKIDGLVSKAITAGKALAAAFAIDKIAGFALGVIKAADDIGDQAVRLNISTQALQEWTYAAGFAEIEGEQLDGIFRKLATTSVDAREAGSEQAKAMSDLGVSLKDANGEFKTTDILFEEIGLSLAGMSDQTKATALAVDFFGKGAGTRVLALFKNGAAGIAQFKKEFAELGGGFDSEFLEQAGKIDDQMKRLDLSWASAKVTLVGVFLPAIQGLITLLTKGAQAIQWINKNTNLFKSGLLILGAVGIAKLSAMLGPLNLLIRSFGMLALKIGLPLLLLEDLITFLEGGDSLIGRGIDKAFGPGASAKVRAFMQDVKKSVEELWGGSWNAFTTNARQTGDEFFMFLAKDMQKLGGFWGGILNGMAEEGGFLWDVLTGGWTNFADKLVALWDGIVLAIQAAWSEIKFFVLEGIAGFSDAINEAISAIPEVVRDKVGITVNEPGSDRKAIQDIHRREKGEIAGKLQQVGARLTAPGPAITKPATVNAPVNVNVDMGGGGGKGGPSVAAVKHAAREGAKAGVAAAKGGAAAPNRQAAATFKRKGRE